MDELARLEEERDFLLRSISDLDREHEAGDVDPADYEELRDGYVARAAEAIRSIEARETALAERRGRVSRGRVLAWVAGVVVFTVVAGVLLAGALGSRGDGVLTGTGVVPGEAADRCRTLSMQKPAEGIDCYDDFLADRPDDVDALTYQGWAKVRSGDVAGGSAQFDRVVELQPDFADVHVFRASVAKDAGDFVTAQAELDRLYELNPAPIVVSTMQQMGLDRTVAAGLLPADVGACWAEEETALAATMTATSGSPESFDRTEIAEALADVARSVQCLDAVLEARPADADALVLRSLAAGFLSILDDKAAAQAAQNADAALVARPGDPAALLLRATFGAASGDLEAAAADLDELGDRRISPLVTPYVDAGQARASIEARRAEINRANEQGVTTTSG